MTRTKVFGKLLLLLFSIVVLYASAQATNLTELLAVSKGDMVSLQLNLFANAAWQISLLQYDVCFYSFFSRIDSTITIELYGMKEKSDDARKAIDQFRMLFKDEFIPFFKGNYGIVIDEINEVKYVYRNRSEEGRKTIYLWEKGKYCYPVKKDF